MTENLNQIWKFDVPIQGPESFLISMPEYSKVLDVQEQNGKFVMWAGVNTLCHIIEREFIWVQTGQSFTLGRRQYLKTVQDGPLVFHLFEVRQ